MNVIWNRLKYVLSPQFDIYTKIAPIVHGRVADIGSGTGFGTHLLTAHADVVHGFEIDEEALLGRHLSGDPPSPAFKARTLAASTAALA